MKHYGDIRTLNGKDLPPVSCITGGSPCQNLSIAGNRTGLDGEQSRLFLEQIRIVKEMRQATNDKFPRFMVWENVPGAFSSNKGEDFRTVLNEIVGISEEHYPDVPKPSKGWTKSGCLYNEVGSWSVAWRLHDAQFWESPNVAKESHLWQILEEEPPQKYCLSPRACRGILTRARRREKVLPKRLENALVAQAQ